MITYEYPLNERIRTLLRLEDLYERVRFFLVRDDPHSHHACLTGIFEILEVSGRLHRIENHYEYSYRVKSVVSSLWMIR